jgi:hypothetical protein
MRSRRHLHGTPSTLPSHSSIPRTQHDRPNNIRYRSAESIHDEDDYPPCCCFQSRRATLGLFFGLLLSWAMVSFVNANAILLEETQRREKDIALDQEVEKSARDLDPGINRPPIRKWAYTFFIGGVPTIPNNETALDQAGYRGLLYNVLVSVKILQDSGSQADMILMVHMAEPYASLPNRDVQMLQKLNLRIYYTPPTLPSYTNGISTIALEKFRILDLVQYSRVLYMEADVMPHCNLDYVFRLSEPANQSVIPF